MANSKNVKVIVGIDFGLTGTAVAFTVYREGMKITPEEVDYVRNWPDADDVVASKVPTVLADSYNIAAGNSTWKWGFAVEPPLPSEPNLTSRRSGGLGSGYTRRAVFKLFLEERMRELEFKNGDPTAEHIRRWYLEFMKRLFRYIQEEIPRKINLKEPSLDLSQCEIQYIFSTPTTWKLEVIDIFRDIILEVGFGRKILTSAEIGLDEAQASAIFAVHESPALQKEGTVLLICDSGGGTTDTTLLRVDEVEENGFCRLGELKAVEGKPIGSSKVDIEASKYLKSLFEHEPIQSAMDELLSQILGIKVKFGSDLWNFEQFRIPVSHLHLPQYKKEAAKMFQKGFLYLPREKFEEWFDIQIDGIIPLLEKQLATSQKMIRSYPSHLFLSGGFGSSPYVQKRLRAVLERYGVELICPKNPELDCPLTVSKGLVIDRVFQLTVGKTTILQSARAHYGIIVREEYKSSRHRGQRCYEDEYDGKLYVDAIKWFIEKDTPLKPTTNLAFQCSRCIPPNATSHSWEENIVVYHGELENRPSYYDGGGPAQIIRRAKCSFAPQLGDDKRGIWKPKRRNLLFGRKYIRLKYDAVVKVCVRDFILEIHCNGEPRNQMGLMHIDGEEINPTGRDEELRSKSF